MLELTLPAVLESIPRAIGFIDQRLEEAGCGVKAQMQIDLAMDELLANIVHYAYAPGTGDMTVRFEFLEESGQAAITLVDGGRPFDPLQQDDPDVTLSIEERPIGGLGIYLVRKTMDEMRYEFRDGRNVLTILKRI